MRKFNNNNKKSLDIHMSKKKKKIEHQFLAPKNKNNNFVFVLHNEWISFIIMKKKNKKISFPKHKDLLLSSQSYNIFVIKAIYQLMRQFFFFLYFSLYTKKAENDHQHQLKKKNRVELVW